ncbi:MAG: glutamine--fructose-6-phosphate transaminase (isomerizing) [Deltaproteobacteria bacterium]|nr:glutamine--fructose-6-phosphate transaminase (isomerizing) [Deltaproteobacteria bacterium]
MCGIVGYVGSERCSDILVDGLRRLEYRGYDSAGTAIMEGGETHILRSQGKLSNLSVLIDEQKPQGTVGIGHTRWATHGRPSEQNAHPHKYGNVAVVHNGIIENHAALRAELEASGHTFSSETDTEIVAHLIDDAFKETKDSLESVRQALCRLEGAYAISVLLDGVPDQIICARQDAPLILGVGENENYIASDVPAILNRTRDMIFLEEGDIAVVRAEGIAISTLDGKSVERKPQKIMWDAMMAEKGGHKHFMLKEIFEQPRAVTDTIRDRVSPTTGDAFIDDFDVDMETLRRVVIVACGTSYHAALVGKFLIESMARIPVEVDLGSEFRYRDPLINKHDLLVGVSQSGETADTLAALREGRGKGARVLSICNVVGSTIPRESDGVLYTHAGPEIGVASTKAFTTQLAALTLLGIHLGRRTGALTEPKAKELINDLLALPEQMKEVLDHSATVDVIARRYANARDFLYLGRGMNYPIALEGALKLKEISYIHAEGYPAGEMKHGPIALIDENLPVVVLAPRGSGYEKIINNLAEVRAREGKVIAIASRGDNEIGNKVDDVIQIPDVRTELQPLLTVLPLQMLAYRIADIRGTDVDQPRNLAKSVTVE